MYLVDSGILVHGKRWSGVAGESILLPALDLLVYD
jgi:hypothetical protein